MSTDIPIPQSSASASSSTPNTPIVLDPNVKKSTFKLYIIQPGTLGLKTSEWRKSITEHDVPVDENWIGNILVDYLKRHPDLHISACPIIRDNSKRVYHLIHTAEYKTHESKQAEQIDSARNHVAEYLLPERQFVWGTVALIAIDEDTKGGMPTETITCTELEHIMARRECAIIVTAEPGQGGSLAEQMLTNAEIDAAIASTPDDSFAERQILGDSGYSISAWKVSSSNEPNWTASRIIASKVTGRWNFAVKKAPGMYTDLTHQEVTQLSHVCAGATSAANLTEREVKKQRSFATRYTLLRDRISRMVDKCQSCNANPEHPQWCSGCYRMRYCNQECRAKHWNEHRKDCSYNNPGLCAPQIASTPAAPTAATQ
jgi:hypothetical protein